MTIQINPCGPSGVAVGQPIFRDRWNADDFVPSKAADELSRQVRVSRKPFHFIPENERLKTLITQVIRDSSLADDVKEKLIASLNSTVNINADDFDYHGIAFAV